MADNRAELEELRRLDELERRAAPKLIGAERDVGEPVKGISLETWKSFTPVQRERMRNPGILGGRLNSAYKIGGEVTDLTGSPLAGYLSNFATNAIPASITSVKGVGAQPELSLAQKPADWLMQSAIKPSQADRISGNALRAVRTMQEEGINATSGGMGKASNLARGLEEQVKSTIAASPESVSAIDVGGRLKPIYDRAKMQVDPHSDLKAIEGTWDAFKSSPAVREQALLGQEFGPQMSGGDVSIPVQLAQQLKSGTYRSLGGKAFNEVGSTSIEAQKALARGLREEIANKVPGVVEPLKREAALMNVKDVAMNRVLGEANKNPLGLAALRMDDPLSAVTFMADKSALAKSLLSRFLYSAGKPSMVAPMGMTAAELKANALTEKIRQGEQQ